MRYVLLCIDEIPDPYDLHRIANTPGVKVIAHSVPRALLIEASQEAADKLRADITKWSVTEEVVYPIPSYPFCNNLTKK